MIWTVLRIQWIGLRRDRVALMLTFALPVAFFTIFVIIFRGTGGGTGRVRVAVADEDHSELSRRLIEGLENEPSLRVRTAKDPNDPQSKLDRNSAEAMVRGGDVPVAIVFPKGLGDSFPNFAGQGPSVELLADTSDPIAPKLVGGLMQKVAMTSAPDLMMSSGFEQFEKYAGAFTPEQRSFIDEWLPKIKDLTRSLQDPSPKKPKDDGSSPNEDKSKSTDDPMSGMLGLVSVKTTDVLGQDKQVPLVSFYAASTGVMFLLFMTAGAGGALLEEVESGTLDRLLSSGLGMNGLLAGKWIYLMLVGFAQITLMYVWGAVAFKVDLLGHIPGFVVMSLATTGAAASVGLLLATLCKSRGQLSGISSIVILSMSSVGGSMFPRFMMSETMQKIGLVTFNAWALDGYVKVFWRDEPLINLAPQVSVLVGIAIVLFAISRMLARRWETA